MALTASSVLGITVADGPILYQLLGDYAPPLIAVLVLSGVVAASFSTASGAILATTAIAVRNIFSVRRHVGTGPDPLLRWTRLVTIPIVVLGSFLALRTSQTGILLTLAFDLMLACLAAPFLIGVFWKRPGAKGGADRRRGRLRCADGAAGAHAHAARGAEHVLHVPNALVGAELDGWCTLIAALVGFGTYVVVGALFSRSETEVLAGAAVRDKLDVEQAGTDAPNSTITRAHEHDTNTTAPQKTSSLVVVAPPFKCLSGCPSSANSVVDAPRR